MCEEALGRLASSLRILRLAFPDGRGLLRPYVRGFHSLCCLNLRPLDLSCVSALVICLLASTVTPRLQSSLAVLAGIGDFSKLKDARTA